MWSGAQQLRLVSNLSVTTRSQQHAVSVFAAVIAKPQPRGATLQAA